MTYTEKHIVETYATLLGGLSDDGKIEIIENLSKTISVAYTREKLFYKTFGSFPSKKSASDIIREIKESRTFNSSDFKL